MNTAALNIQPPEQAAPARKLSFSIVNRDWNNHESLLDLVAAAHAESRYGDIPFSRDKARRHLETALNDQRRHFAAVAEVGGQVVGFVYATVGEYWVGTGALIVTINTIYTSKELRNSLLGGRAAVVLFRGVAKWAKGIGAREILVHVTSGIDEPRAKASLRHLGFNMGGSTFVSQLSMQTQRDMGEQR